MRTSRQPRTEWRGGGARRTLPPLPHPHTLLHARRGVARVGTRGMPAPNFPHCRRFGHCVLHFYHQLPQSRGKRPSKSFRPGLGWGVDRPAAAAASRRVRFDAHSKPRQKASDHRHQKGSPSKSIRSPRADAMALAASPTNPTSPLKPQMRRDSNLNPPSRASPRGPSLRRTRARNRKSGATLTLTLTLPPAARAKRAPAAKPPRIRPRS